MYIIINILFCLLLVVERNFSLSVYEHSFPNRTTEPHYSYRLPTSVVPHEYKLFIEPNLNEGVYYGEVSIFVKAYENTPTVTLHSKLLNILNSSINDENVNFVYGINDYLVLKPDKHLVKGASYKIMITFEGDMKNKTFGFHRGFDEIDNKTVYFGATFFEPVNARTAFPCFDEPNLKANFQVVIMRPLGYIALSNTPIKSIENDIVTFHKTPKMSTYLVSFFVGNYSYAESFLTTKDNRVIPLRIYVPPHLTKNVQYAVEQIPKLLVWFNEYTGFDYPLPKLDFLAINPQFHIEGGMEDWGLISIRSAEVFAESDNLSDGQKEGITFSMAHEMGHLWFGDLVTLNFWNEFWLNEGFARFFDMKSQDAYPDVYKIGTIYGKDSNLADAFWFDDDIYNSKPLIRQMKNPDDVYGILNIIPYNKGSSILQMIEDTITPEKFKMFIQSYLKEHQYKNVQTKDLLQSLQPFLNFNVDTFLSGWTRQGGYPLVMVNLNETGIILTQTRFLRLGQSEPEKTKTKWTIPIRYINNMSLQPNLFWLKDFEQTGYLKFNMSQLRWIKLNYKFGGYYRVLYPKEMRVFFSNNMMAFSIEDRVNLLDDSFGLVRSGHITCSEGLEFTKYLRQETNKHAWNNAQRIFRTLKINFIKNSIPLDHLRKYVSNVISGPYQQVGWSEHSNETYLDRENRKTVLNAACAYGHENCLQTAKQLFNDRHALPPNISPIVSSYGYGKNHVPNMKETVDMDPSFSLFFGADMSKLAKENIFTWPKNILNECNNWFEKQNTVT